MIYSTLARRSRRPRNLDSTEDGAETPGDLLESHSHSPRIRTPLQLPRPLALAPALARVALFPSLIVFRLPVRDPRVLRVPATVLPVDPTTVRRPCLPSSAHHDRLTPLGQVHIDPQPPALTTYKNSRSESGSFKSAHHIESSGALAMPSLLPAANLIPGRPSIPTDGSPSGSNRA